MQKYNLTLIFILFAIGIQSISMVYAQSGSNSFHHDLKSEKMPWTKIPEVDAQNFRFIITGDHTGGEVPGVFDYAVQRINELAPDFVITVGDIIEGYTRSENDMQNQWDALMHSLNLLEVPFFVAPGNHDVTNKMLLDEWKKRWGYDYYNFYVGDCLFLVLNSTEPGINGFADHQIEFFERVLDKHKINNPVFVITHDPLWKMKDENGVEKLNGLLEKHNVTFFCGHEHRYQYRMIDGKTHYMLAGLASGNNRGTNLGEYYNFMQVTMKNGEMRIANFNLEGMLPLDIVNNNTIKQVDVLRGEDWAYIKPVVVDNETTRLVQGFLHLENPGEFPLHINGQWTDTEIATIAPEKIESVIMPGKSLKIPVFLSLTKGYGISDLPLLKPLLTGRYEQDGKNLEASTSPVWHIDFIKTVKNERQNPKSSEWLVPERIEESWDWSGMEDAAFALQTSADNNNLYITATVQDDNWIENTPYDTQGDIFQISIHPDTTFLSKAEPIIFEFRPAERKGKCINGCDRVSDYTAKINREGKYMITEISIPLKPFDHQWFRMNMSFSDVDNPHKSDNAVLWWKPPWQSDDDYPGSGLFHHDKEN